MTIGTTRFFQNNMELFSKLTTELEKLQVEAGSGQNELKLSKHYRDVANLNAAEEKRSETSQYIMNSKRLQTDLENLDLAMERIQNLMIRIQEISVESANDVLEPQDRAMYIQETRMLKDELIDIANQTDSFGNTLFGGISAEKNPFELKGDGSVVYSGSAVAKNVQVTSGLMVTQNFSGSKVFENIKGENGSFSIFELINNLTESLSNELNSGISSNLLGTSDSTLLEFPDSGAEAEISFSLITEEGETNYSARVYGNDYSNLAEIINSSTGATGITATYEGNNRITLESTHEELYIDKFRQNSLSDPDAQIRVLDSNSLAVTEAVSQSKLNNGDISLRVSDAFKHISTMRAEVATSSRRAKDAEDTNQDLLAELEKDISEIKDADLASLLTKIQMLMLQKDAAQATFTRISSKSLFDLMG